MIGADILFIKGGHGLTKYLVTSDNYTVYGYPFIMSQRSKRFANTQDIYEGEQHLLPFIQLDHNTLKLFQYLWCWMKGFNMKKFHEKIYIH